MRVGKPAAPFSRCSLLGPGGSLGSQGAAWHKWGAGLGHRVQVWPQPQPPAYSLWDPGLLETKGLPGSVLCPGTGKWAAHPALPFPGLILQASRVDADPSAATSCPSASYASCRASSAQLTQASALPEGPREGSSKKGNKHGCAMIQRKIYMNFLKTKRRLFRSGCLDGIRPSLQTLQS